MNTNSEIACLSIANSALLALIGFCLLLSTNAYSGAPEDYLSMGCASSTCHGNPKGSGSVPLPVTRARFPANTDLAEYIATSMPPSPLPTGICDLLSGCATAMAAYLRPNSPPVANASAPGSHTGPAPFTVNFSSADSSDDVDITDYSWNFGDGPLTSSASNPVHTFSSPGNYNVVLTVTDIDDESDSSAAITITVTPPLPNAPPVANLSNSSNRDGNAPHTPNLDASASTDDDDIVSYSWDFGDGSPAGSGVTPGHTYTVPGKYYAKVTVTDTDGATHSSQVLIEIFGPPQADIQHTALSGIVPWFVTFNAKDSYCEGGCTTYEWDFGDGEGFPPGGISNPSHEFWDAGNYTVILTVTDSLGRSDTASVTVNGIAGETITEYVDQCQAVLDFEDDDIPPVMKCVDGYLFAPNGDGNAEQNDFVGHVQVTDKVDLVFACRWLQGAGAGNDFNPPFVSQVSTELIIHNRETGDTCFFEAHSRSVDLVSPTVAARAASGTPESRFWSPPAEIERGLPCVDCHVAGPYIATPRIAPFLARFGLLNDGHDTFGLVREGVNLVGKYHIVGDTFAHFDDMAADFNVIDSCAEACHSIGHNSTQVDDIRAGLGSVLLPSIINVIDTLGTEQDDISVKTSGVMPADNPTTGLSPESTGYTWINQNNPFGNNSGDSETLIEARTEYNQLLSYCGAPTVLEATAIGTDYFFNTVPLPDKLAVFNARDGLVCNKRDQDDNQCYDYEVRYQCTNETTGEVNWSNNWHNSDSPGGESDNEARHRHHNVCGGLKITGIQAQTTLSNGRTDAYYGPPERLHKFTPFGLECRNSDQEDGQCFNYVVNYEACTDAPVDHAAHIVSNWSGMQLTASNSNNNALVKGQSFTPSWNTQEWMIEPITDTGIIRLRNTGTNTYLNARDNIDFSPVETYQDMDWGSEQWIMETVSGSTNVRFKNVWTGRYLTMRDSSNYSDIYAQPYNNGWPSQAWRIQ